MSQSEVARILHQIEQEYQASKRALEGLASGMARHDFMQKRAENKGFFAFSQALLNVFPRYEIPQGVICQLL